MLTQAFILAGGKGERLKPLTETIPKSLIKLNKLSLVEYWIEFFKKNNVKDFIIAVGHMGDKIVEHVGDGSKYGVQVRYTKEEQPSRLTFFGARTILVRNFQEIGRTKASSAPPIPSDRPLILRSCDLGVC